MSIILDSKIPSGPLEQKWSKHKMDSKLINPANKRKYEVIVVGAGLAGSSAAATHAELGYKVKCFVFHHSPRRAPPAPGGSGGNSGRATNEVKKFKTSSLLSGASSMIRVVKFALT